MSARGAIRRLKAHFANETVDKLAEESVSRLSLGA